jgi:hypothetical protein
VFGFYSLNKHKISYTSTLFKVQFLAHLPLGQVSYCHHFLSVVRPSSTFHILIFSSETTESIATKLWWNGPWMAPFQNVSGDPDFQPS